MQCVCCVPSGAVPGWQSPAGLELSLVGRALLGWSSAFTSCCQHSHRAETGPHNAPVSGAHTHPHIPLTHKHTPHRYTHTTLLLHTQKYTIHIWYTVYGLCMFVW